jgi:V8-like Glu-specific endopeptidase
MPNMFGTNPGYRFTSSRLTQDAVAALGAEAKYPNAINGQLFFKVPAGRTVPPGRYVCSATVQRPRIITTAGHCVSDGNGHFFKNWTFVPALRNGVGPFGTWNAAYVVVSNVWHFGGGVLPNGQDVASIELLDDASGNKIGDFTGYAGYQIPALYGGQHLTSNGYPCNIDGCNKMHRVDAEARLGANNTAIIGSDMRGGTSGGGWLMNWGEYGVGEPPASGNEAGGLRLIAVTSYGPVAVESLFQGASILDERYVNSSNTGVLNVVCAHRAGNC